MIHFFKRTFLNPLQEFINDSRSIGIVLLLCTFVSIVVANSPAGLPYQQFWNMATPVLPYVQLPPTFFHWINEGLMAIFFFLVGMEIKRELVHGELASIRKSILPVIAAVGGMLFPAIIYLLFNYHTTAAGGWGIPTATDIAFSLGIASLLGKRVPVVLKIFLTALAIIDDLGAIVVIALFYGEAIQWFYLVADVVLVAAVLFINHALKKFGVIQILLGIVLWYCTYNSGIHATIAGVIFAFLVPVRYLVYLENKIHHYVYFIIMPLFALANTIIVFPVGGIGVLKDAMPMGIMLALAVGKPLGITTASWIMIKTKQADLPAHTNWHQLIGVGMLAGIGFTMSIFISTLAFVAPGDQDIAKIAVLISSIFSMVLGFVWLSIGKEKKKQAPLNS